jgi:uncharacterized phage protein (TIGR02220 family)
VRIAPKNWQSFQHYKKRNPPWIRLYRALLDDRAFHSLPLASRALAPMLWLLASENENGIINADPSELAFRLRQTEKQIGEALEPLMDKGFFLFAEGGDSASLADCLQRATPEAEAEADHKPLLSGKPDGGRSQRKAQFKTEAVQYLDFLNAKAGKHFRPVLTNLRIVEARLSEGVTLQDLKTLTVRKCREWLGTDQEKYLRPETLCNATKCHSYLGEIAPEIPCNAQPATEASSPQPSPAIADGLPPTSHEALPHLH